MEALAPCRAEGALADSRILKQMAAELIFGMSGPENKEGSLYPSPAVQSPRPGAAAASTVKWSESPAMLPVSVLAEPTLTAEYGSGNRS